MCETATASATQFNQNYNCMVRKVNLALTEAFYTLVIAPTLTLGHFLECILYKVTAKELQSDCVYDEKFFLFFLFSLSLYVYKLQILTGQFFHILFYT